jgi:hypothetical protein
VDAQGLGLEDAGRIVAFGDFNGDQLYVMAQFVVVSLIDNG